ncbi:MAG: hypothetical protein GY937_06070 [bacterium]|nr:hypothetical protein [bacterium]
MPDVCNVELRIEQVATPADRWTVSIAYHLRVQPWEAGSWIREEVELVGGEPGMAEPLEVLVRWSNSPWPLPASDPSEGGEPATEVRLIQREIPPRAFGPDVLDENPDARHLRADLVPVGGRLLLRLREHVEIRQDRLSARVRVESMTATAGTGRSPLVVGRFGGTR